MCVSAFLHLHTFPSLFRPRPPVLSPSALGLMLSFTVSLLCVRRLRASCRAQYLILTPSHLTRARPIVDCNKFSRWYKYLTLHLFERQTIIRLALPLPFLCVCLTLPSPDCSTLTRSPRAVMHRTSPCAVPQSVHATSLRPRSSPSSHVLDVREEDGPFLDLSNTPHTSCSLQRTQCRLSYLTNLQTLLSPHRLGPISTWPLAVTYITNKTSL